MCYYSPYIVYDTIIIIVSNCFILFHYYVRKKISLEESCAVKLKNICIVNEDSCPELCYSAEQELYYHLISFDQIILY